VSFHDLRLSCALRWARRLTPQELMEFMRHSSMQVTLDYYVGERAMETAARMWDIKPECSVVGANRFPDDRSTAM